MKEAFWVSSSTIPGRLAGAIAGALKKGNSVEVLAIGAGAVNQAVKAVAVARGYTAPGGADLSVVPSFREMEVEGEEKTAMRLEVRKA